MQGPLTASRFPSSVAAVPTIGCLLYATVCSFVLGIITGFYLCWGRGKRWKRGEGAEARRGNTARRGMQRPLGGSRSIYLSYKCFLSTYCVLPTVRAF